MTFETNTEANDLSLTGLADSFDRIASAALEKSKKYADGTPESNMFDDIYDIFNDEAENLRGGDDDDNDED